MAPLKQKSDGDALPLAGICILEFGHTVMGLSCSMVLADLGADALIENFGHGTMDRLGIGYEVLSKLHPGLVYCSLKGFLSGPYEERPALDEIVQFMGGLAYMTGPTGRSLRAGASVVDIMGGMFGALGIMAALRERDRTGRGQFVQSALFESTAFLVAQHMGQQALTGVAPPPMPEKLPGRL